MITGKTHSTWVSAQPQVPSNLDSIRPALSFHPQETWQSAKTHWPLSFGNHHFHFQLCSVRARCGSLVSCSRERLTQVQYPGVESLCFLFWPVSSWSCHLVTWSHKFLFTNKCLINDQYYLLLKCLGRFFPWSSKPGHSFVSWVFSLKFLTGAQVILIKSVIELLHQGFFKNTWWPDPIPYQLKSNVCKWREALQDSPNYSDSLVGLRITWFNIILFSWDSTGIYRQRLILSIDGQSDKTVSYENWLEKINVFNFSEVKGKPL
jgi:hypothetical protein